MVDDVPHDSAERAGVTRRSVLLTLGAVGGLAVAAGRASDTGPTSVGPATAGDVADPERTPLPPEDEEAGLQFLTGEEAHTVDAVLARLVPGDAADPGAVEAGVTTYIDRKLAALEAAGTDAFVQPTFLAGPWAVGTPRAGADAVDVRADQLYRYGYQSGNTPQRIYRLGVPALDRYTQTRFGSRFADLAPSRQDEVLLVLEGVQSRTERFSQTDDAAPGEDATTSESTESGSSGAVDPTLLDQAEDAFGEIGPGEFFTTVRGDAIEGMFSDPAYGGNRDLAGWSLVGWPAAQRSYSPAEMLSGRTAKQPRSMDHLPAMNPDRRGGGREALEKSRPGVHGGHG